MERKKYVTEKISENPELPLSCKQILLSSEKTGDHDLYLLTG